MNSIPKKALLILAGDALLILLAFYLAPAIRFGILPGGSLIFDWPDLWAVIVYLSVFYLLDSYRSDEDPRSFGYALRFLSAIVIADICIVTMFYLLNVRPHTTVILFLHSLMVFSFCMGWRILLYRFSTEVMAVRRVLLVGAGHAGQDLCHMLAENGDYVVTTVLDDDPEKWGTEFCGMRVAGGTELLPSLLGSVDLVVVAITHAMSPQLYRLLMDAKMRGTTVYELPSFYELILLKIPVRHVSDLWFVYAPISGVRRNLYNQKLKRIFDVLVSMLGLLCTLPLVLLTATAVRLESPGPFFYVHPRIGLNGRPFELFKLRTMKNNSENDREHAGKKNDPRITQVGRVVRFFRIDEIPQMWNVIRGDMSFIGPRALIGQEVEAFTPNIPYFSLRHSIRPGITGWAQVNYPHGVTPEDAMAKLEYDLYYIKNLSFFLDLFILARTVRTVLLGRGAR